VPEYTRDEPSGTGAPAPASISHTTRSRG